MKYSRPILRAVSSIFNRCVDGSSAIAGSYDGQCEGGNAPADGCTTGTVDGGGNCMLGSGATGDPGCLNGNSATRACGYGSSPGWLWSDCGVGGGAVNCSSGSGAG